MKCAIILLVCVAAALAAPEKRFFIQDIKDALDLAVVKDTVQKLVDQIGSDPTEALCEGTCHNAIAMSGSLLHSSCGLVCKGFQQLVHHFNIHPDPTTTMTV